MWSAVCSAESGLYEYEGALCSAGKAYMNMKVHYVVQEVAYMNMKCIMQCKKSLIWIWSALSNWKR